MKPKILLSGLFFVLAPFVFSGCQTMADRIGFAVRARIHAKAYSALDPATQSRLGRGIVLIGDSKVMVAIALGKPDLKSASGGEEEWTYTVFSGDSLDGGSGRHLILEGGSFSSGKRVRFAPDKFNQMRVVGID